MHQCGVQLALELVRVLAQVVLQGGAAAWGRGGVGAWKFWGRGGVGAWGGGGGGGVAAWGRRGVGAWGTGEAATNQHD